MRKLRYLVLLKLLSVTLLVSGCAYLRRQWPVEDHGGVAPKPAASDLYFLGGGFVVDAALAHAKVPVVPRVVVDGLAAWAVRVPKWGGRTEAAHILVVGGAFLDAWVRGIVKAFR